MIEVGEGGADWTVEQNTKDDAAEGESIPFKGMRIARIFIPLEGMAGRW